MGLFLLDYKTTPPMSHSNYEFKPLAHEEQSPEKMLEQAQTLYTNLNGRRTVREFSDRPVDRKVIERPTTCERYMHRQCAIGGDDMAASSRCDGRDP